MSYTRRNLIRVIRKAACNAYLIASLSACEAAYTMPIMSTQRKLLYFMFTLDKYKKKGSRA